MAKFYDVVGYGDTVEAARGVFKDVIVERHYYGDILENSRRLDDNDQLNKELTLNNSISIVADAYAGEHFFAIRYVKLAGARWTVTQVTVKGPRLVLRLGEVYNGPIPA